MKNKGLLIGGILVLGFVFMLYWMLGGQHSEADTDISVSASIDNIIYSKHAKCRMECRYIDEQEIKEIILKGNINHSKTREDKRGRTFAYEGRTHDGQQVRIIVAPQRSKLTIVTVIDLKNDWNCECP